MKAAHESYGTCERMKWISEHAAQVLLAVTQQQWALDVHNILERENEAKDMSPLLTLELKLSKELETFQKQLRTDVSYLYRKILTNLMVVRIYNRDVTSSLGKNNVISV